MHNCANCDWIERPSLRLNKANEPQAHENSWLCRRFKRFHKSIVTGQGIPFHTARDVKYITMDQDGNCEFYVEREDAEPTHKNT